MAKKKSAVQEVVILDEFIGSEDETKLHIHADLNFLMSDIADYTSKLKAARDIPENTDELLPDNPLIKIIADQITDMPDTSPREQAAKYAYIGGEIRQFNMRNASQAERDATMLSITMNNLFEGVEPISYIPRATRERPGLLTLPEPTRDLTNPVEGRLKCLMDRLGQVDGMYSDFMRIVETMSVSVNQRLLTPRDNDGFQPGAAD